MLQSYNFNNTFNKYPVIPNYQDFPVIKFAKMKKDKPGYSTNLDKTNYNSNSNSKFFNNNNNNNFSTYYSTTSYPDLYLANSTNKNFLESKKNFSLSTMYKTKEETGNGFFPKSKVFYTYKKSEDNNEKNDKYEKVEKNEKSDKEKSSEKYHIKNLEFRATSRKTNKNNFNMNTSQISTFISPSRRFNNFNNNNILNNNNLNYNLKENSYINHQNHKNNNYHGNQSFFHSINITHNGFNTSRSNYYKNANKVNFGTNTIFNNNSFANNQNKDNDLSAYSGNASKLSNLNFLYPLNNIQMNKNYNNSNDENKRNKSINKKTIDMNDFDQFEQYKENYMKMREEQFLKDTAYYIYNNYNKKKFKKYIFKEIPNNDYFKKLIDKITRLVEIKRNNNELVSVEYIMNMLREEIEDDKIAPIKVKNEDLLLPLINKKYSHANLEYESEFEKNRRLIKKLKKSKRKNKYFTSCISEEVENYWENKNSKNDDSYEFKGPKDKIKISDNLIINNINKKGKKKKFSEDSDYYETDSEFSDNNENKKRKRKKRRNSDSGNSFSEDESSYIDSDISEYEKKRRKRRRRKHYINHPKTTDIAKKLLGNIEINLDKDMKFLNTQKNFFMKRLDSFLITQSSGFDGLSDHMLRKTLSFLDKYGKKRKKHKNNKSIGNKEMTASQITDYAQIKPKENYEDYELDSNGNYVEKRKSFMLGDTYDDNNSNYFKSNLNSPIKSNAAKAGTLLRSPTKKKVNMFDLKKQKSISNFNNNSFKSPKKSLTRSPGGKKYLNQESGSGENNTNPEGKLTTENNDSCKGILNHLNGSVDTEENKISENNQPNKKMRKRTIKKLKEGSLVGNEEYEEFEIEETDPDANGENLENPEEGKQYLKNEDLESIGINSFKKFMMESLFIPQIPEEDDKNKKEAEKK